MRKLVLFTLAITFLYVLPITAQKKSQINVKLTVSEGKSFLDPPEIIKDPSTHEDYTPGSRKWTGIASMAVSPGGRMWAVWYSGKTPKEDLNNYVVVATSDDGGKNWKELFVIDPDGPGEIRAFDPEIWIAPDGRLWIFWAQNIFPIRSTSNGVWAMTTQDLESDNPEWSEPRRLVDGVMMCKPIVMSTGEWVLPVSFWQELEESAKMVVSDDKGKNWFVRGGVHIPQEDRNHDEHMIVERKDGSLWMLVRTNYGIGESISTDKGFTWTPLIPARIQHTASRFFITRVSSGNLLLIKHGPIDMKTGRSHLMAFISNDDGYSWSNGLLLDARQAVSYPDAQQTSNGTIYTVYDHNRAKDQQILFTSFTEDDITMGSDRKILEVFKRRQVISEGGQN